MNNSVSNFTDEIDLQVILRIILKYKYVLLIFVVIGAVFSFSMSKKAPELYYSSTTFFLPLSESQSAPQLSGYAKLFGGSSASGIEAMLIDLVESRRMQRKIAKDLSGYYKKLNRDEIIDKLNLGAYSNLIKKGNIYLMSYKSTDKNVVTKVIASYLKNLEVLNEELGLVANKNFITVLDQAEEPLYPSKADSKRYIGIGILVSFFAGLIFVFIFEFGILIVRKDKK